ncbi:MAG TPA: hypothetical protein VFL14_04045 [Xanthomonadales bacterium]|nr:hypothetical protein [Xanthomonadales bacterium]
MSSLARAVLAIAIVVGCGCTGFVLSTLFAIFRAIPDLAGGGHATGHAPENMAVPFTVGGVVAGIALAAWIWKLTGPRRR